jgi:hypothetical protein
VAENIMSFDQKLWLRIASRCDTASEDEKARLMSLANSAMALVETMVKQTEAQLSDGGTLVQDILKAGADKDGVWHVPLPAARVQAMREVRLHMFSCLCSGAP